MPAPPPSPARRTVERLSLRPLTWLTARNRLILPAISAALLLAGLGLPPIEGTPFLVALVALVGWLGYLSWPLASRNARVLRLVTLLVVVAAGALRLARPR